MGCGSDVMVVHTATKATWAGAWCSWHSQQQQQQQQKVRLKQQGSQSEPMSSFPAEALRDELSQVLACRLGHCKSSGVSCHMLVSFAA